MKGNRLIAACAVLLSFCFFAVPRPKTAFAATEAKGECVVEATSRRILHEKDATRRLPMASTTKILTASVILEDCDLEETVVIPKEAEGEEGSSVYLKAGDEYSVRDLLYGLMLRSGNDCAVSLAIHHSGSVERFAEVMTVRAAMMGAENSSFKNPHGLPDGGHYTTARDLALVAAHALGNETFREIVSCKFYEPRGWKNKNKMLWQYEGATGVKTGFTVNAGRCLVTSAEREGMRLVCVVLGCPEMYERTAELLDGAYEAYSMIPLCDASAPWEGFAIKYGFAYPLKKTELRALRFADELLSPLPDRSGALAGQMKIYLENSLIFSQNLYIM